jgi:hypothetical protein
MDVVAEVMFQVGKLPLEIIICPLDVVKCNFGKVDEAMFQVVEKP